MNNYHVDRREMDGGRESKRQTEMEMKMEIRRCTELKSNAEIY